jgi:hypothetical protein
MQHFSLAEFACKCGCGYDAISPALVAKLELARDDANLIYNASPHGSESPNLKTVRGELSFVITSGCRCASHNKKVGGVAGSAHTKGLAADIAVTSRTRDIILTALRKHFKRIGIASNFIHVDIDDSKSQKEWRYD